jgi:signal transduction histidine kinase
VVVDLVVDDLAQSARDKHVEIDLAGCQQPLPGSAEMLYLLIRNLLDNSIRNVSVGGHVALEVSAAGDCAVLTIRDDGPGIPAAERARAFERFYRIPGSASGGSGLGLSIVGRVVELLRGDIRLSEPAAGSGLIVTISLPFGAAPAQGRTAA